MLTVIEGEVEDKGSQGRRPTEWKDNLREWRNGMQYARGSAIDRDAYVPNWSMANWIEYQSD